MKSVEEQLAQMSFGAAEILPLDELRKKLVWILPRRIFTSDTR